MSLNIHDVAFADVKLTLVASSGDHYMDTGAQTWHVVAPGVDVHYTAWSTRNMSGGDWHTGAVPPRDGGSANLTPLLDGREVFVTDLPDDLREDARVMIGGDESSFPLDDLISILIEDVELRGSREPYRLAPDQGDPLTIAQVASDQAPTIAGDRLSENYARAVQAARMVATSGYDGDEDEANVRDLLSDLFHLADLLGMDLDTQVNWSANRYREEIA